MALENVPVSFYDKAMLGLPGRDEQIAHMQSTIRNMGRAGIPILGYHWMPNGVWRTQEPATLRGGARGTRFDLAEHDPDELTHGREFTSDEMWANYEYYLERILPVAEESNVKLALHPDDPPVETLGGVARIFRNFDGFAARHGHLRQPPPRPGFLHGLLVRNGRAGERAARDSPLWAARPDHLRSLPRRAGAGLLL